MQFRTIRSVFILLHSLLLLPPATQAIPGIKSVEFIGMAQPSTVDEKSSIYSGAKVRFEYANGDSEVYPLKYYQLMTTTDTISGNLVGGLFNAKDKPIMDTYGQMASDAPDGTSLIKIPGLRVSDARNTDTLALVTQYEYRELPPDYPDGTEDTYQKYWSKLPALMSLSMLEQDLNDGLLKVIDYQPISFSHVNGGWLHCGSTLSNWNTHIGSEEYEPDARTREFPHSKAADSDDKTDIKAYSKYYFDDAASANPYHYGWVPEVTIDKTGHVSVVKHHAPGRFAREMQEMATDNRTAIAGDDGKHTGLFMFVADEAKDLSAGTLYAASVTQVNNSTGYYFDVDWIRLGHATDAEIQYLIDKKIKFSDIFDFMPVASEKCLTCDRELVSDGYRKVTTYTGTEWLRLKPGMEKAAAFLETRRYAALSGATTEFNKMEYIAFNREERTFYLAISRVAAGMADQRGDIQLVRNDGGLILHMLTAEEQSDSNGKMINSTFVGTRLEPIPALTGGWPLPGKFESKKGSGMDIEGNRCSQDRICGPDNIRYVESIKTLFIGEDTNRRNNNYVWSYNIESKKLSRILSVPLAAEATGLMVAPNYNGFGYIMSNFQHPGAEEDFDNYLGLDHEEIREKLNQKWANKKKAAIGYIGIAVSPERARSGKGISYRALPAFD